MSILKKLFGIKPNIPEAADITSIPQSWSVLEGKNNGMPMIVRKNVGCDKIAGHKAYTTNCGIAFNLLAPTADGLPNFELEPSLNKLEDDIFETLEFDFNSVIPIVITTSGFREFVIYTKDINKFEEGLENIKSKYPRYELTSFNKPDPGWKTYKSFK
ncbi:DUF695 domain-containing protein [Pedobacter borealis]|uniref:DUF695 domain-containing protein n=1 Tax=Pedobacter borealis TaxID=475254 RepID=UPI000493AAAF|nr:DUF695 domain-containing protein [Pedobacter borealis]